MIGFAVGMLFIGVVLFFWISFLTRDERMIEGIPEGWELVRIGKPAVGEYYIDVTGSIYKALDTTPTVLHWYVPVIRKIEKPKQYRAFASAAEAYCLWNAVLKLANPANGSEDSRYRINSITRDGATIGLQVVDYRKAFEMFVCIDGSPFGVECEVTE